MTLSHMATCHHLERAKEQRDLAGKQTPVAFVPLTLSAWQISISNFLGRLVKLARTAVTWNTASKPGNEIMLKADFIKVFQL